MKRLFITVLFGFLSANLGHAGDTRSGAAATVSAASAEPVNSGEIRKVDKAAKKLTIKHGPLVKLDMPAMTMVFQVKDPALLERVKPGDRVKFDAERLGGAFVVTRIESAP